MNKWQLGSDGYRDVFTTYQTSILKPMLRVNPMDYLGHVVTITVKGRKIFWFLIYN
jgi:hypothetical protein